MSSQKYRTERKLREEQQRAWLLNFIATFGRMPPREKPKQDSRTGRQILEAAGYLKKERKDADQRGT